MCLILLVLLMKTNFLVCPVVFGCMLHCMWKFILRNYLRRIVYVLPSRKNVLLLLQGAWGHYNSMTSLSQINALHYLYKPRIWKHYEIPHELCHFDLLSPLSTWTFGVSGSLWREWWKGVGCREVLIECPFVYRLWDFFSISSHSASHEK